MIQCDVYVDSQTIFAGHINHFSNIIHPVTVNSDYRLDLDGQLACQLSIDQSYLARSANLPIGLCTVSYTHLRAHETVLDLVCRLLLEKKCPH